MKSSDLYQSAGVNIDAGNEAAAKYARLANRTKRPEVLGGIGGFSGGFQLDIQKYPMPVLVSGTDGVGTKIKLAFATGRHNTIGIDCVAMCVNDILTSGAEPLFFLDYLAVGGLDVGTAEAIVAGVADGCDMAGCALVGGETAEMPDMYKPGEYDLAGTSVGVVNKDAMIDGSLVQAGDVIIGLESNGVHSNGFSLIHKLLSAAGVGLDSTLPGFRGTVVDELLRPTQIYVRAIHGILELGIPVKAMAHITGGGLVDNLPRSLPEHLSANLHPGSWPVQPVFQWLQAESGLEFGEAARIWNMGIGFTLVIGREDAQRVLAALGDHGQAAHVIGEVVESKKHSVLWEG